MLNIVCIQGEYSAEYVNILADMVGRNISDQQAYKFICFTDTSEGLDSEIDIRPAVNKSSIKYLFPKNDRILFLEMTTVITGGLDDIIMFNEDFHELKINGDSVISYKDAIGNIQRHSRVVLFDGDVKPHEVKAGWIPYVWKIGGGTTLELKHICNTPDEHIFNNVRNALKLPFPWLKMQDAHEGHAVIVGGGPSLKNDLQEIGERQKRGQVIFSTNGTYSYLIKNGIVSDAHVMIDAREENKEFIPAISGATHYIASQCHPEVFEKAKDKNTVLFHSFFSDGIFDVIGHESGDPLVGGGCTVGLHAIALAWILGYRKFHLYGFDSSYHEEQNHAYPQALNDNDKVIEVVMNNQKYRVAPWMATQVDHFKALAKELVDSGCIITVHGKGLLPDVAKIMAKPERIMNAVYDLAVSPPTYEFLTFLCAAEKARIEGDYDGLNIIFQPGPRYGFRDDNLPPDAETRKSMLSRICIPACWLLPSVRDVFVLSKRAEMEVEFPVGWTLKEPVSCYGMSVVIKNPPRALQATDSAKKMVAKYYPGEYVTVTYRQADYWQERNSDFEEWKKAISQIEAMGYKVVIVDDTEASANVFSWDIDFRTALYQGAILNMGISNGPMMLALLCNSPYMIFRQVTKGNLSVGYEFLKRNGIEKGDQWSDTGNVVWEDDTAEVIVREFKAFIDSKTNLSKAA